MKLATFADGNSARIGIVVGELVIDLSAAAPDLPTDMTAFLAAGDAAMDRAREVQDDADHAVPVDNVEFLAPVPRPGKILAIGLNYADHIAETGAQTPTTQIWFNKQTTATNAPYAGITKPSVSDRVDYEGELVFVIGKRAKHVPVERASEVIAGYCCGNDVSVRDWQAASRTMQMGKSFDTHAPFGPWIATPDEVGDPHTLDLRTYVNGEKRQDSNTRHLVFNCFEQIAHLTKAFTLEPGDVIFTGTSAGVATAMDPPPWLKVGDVVRIEIDRVGYIENTVVEEEANTVVG
ncbi:MAG: fumarylacetoacetate hydrolase family protein [Gammaproteobacteria bacterium]|nr:fumarylacetoacetate hydrolase family protein [Gammaproteobacteria bacterium]MDE0453196.1 fumarylacetoacetate hydrolase family protein [Gammaproteobacteria bacterium]